MAALYTEDAIIVPPGAEMAEGGEAIEAFWQGCIDSGMKDLKLEAVEVEGYGEAAREIGRFSATAGEKEIAGKYVVVWKKGEDGKWQLDTDMEHEQRLTMSADHPLGEQPCLATAAPMR